MEVGSGKFSIRPVSIRQWGDEYLIYNELTADTHLFDLYSGGLISEMSGKQQVSKQEMIQFLLKNYDGFTAQEIEQYVEDILVKFQQMDLLETGL